MFSATLRKLFGPARRSPRKTFRPALERMEDRTVPATVKVSPAAMNGWALTQSGTATASFVNGPATPPLGTGSVQLAVGADGNSAAQARSTALTGTKLADVTALSYSTYVQQDGSGGQAPYILLNLDNDSNGTIDDQLFFEPVYQDGTYSGESVPNQGSVAVGTWQTWDAKVGGWWSLNAFTFGPPLVTLASYTAAHPNATIVNSTNGLGGLRFVAGFGAGAWDNFIGNVDKVTVDTAAPAQATTYDFDLASVRVYKNGTTSLAVDESTGQFTFTYKEGTVTHTLTGTGARVQNGKLKIHATATDQNGDLVKIDVNSDVSGPVTVNLRGKDKKEFAGLTLQAM